MVVTSRTELTVDWPVQGAVCLRSRESELVLSDVYWRWIFEALADSGEPLAFVDAVTNDPSDPSQFVQTVQATPAFLDLLRRIEPARAPSFELVKPTNGGPPPTAEQILAAFERVAAEAVASGTLDIEFL